MSFNSYYSLTKTGKQLETENFFKDKQFLTQHLYIDPLTNRPFYHKGKTDSKESYSNDVKKTRFAIANNGNKIKHEIKVNLLKIFSIQYLREQWEIIRRFLLKEGIIAYGTREITCDPVYDPKTKEWIKKPSNRFHYHFIVVNQIPKQQLLTIFRTAFSKAGLIENDDFMITHKKITDITKVSFYFTKYQVWDKIILFRPKLGFQKFVKVGKFFVDKNGKETTVDELFEPAKELRRKIEKIKDDYKHFFKFAGVVDQFKHKDWRELIYNLENGIISLDRF